MATQYQSPYNNPNPQTTYPTPPGGSFGLPENFDNTGFQEAQRYTESTGTQITPQEFARFAGLSAGQPLTPGLQNMYRQLYQNTAWYNPDGSTTAAAPLTATLFPHYQSPGQYQPMEPVATAKDFLGEVEASPYYQFQLQEGQKALDRLASSRGFTNSGKEIQANSDLVNRLSAEETERQYSRAQQIAEAENARRRFNTQLGNEFNFQSSNAFNSHLAGQSGLLGGLLSDSADRQERASNTQFNRLFNTLQLMLGSAPTNFTGQAGSAIQSNANSAASILGQIGNAYGNAVTPQYQPDTGAGQGFNIFGSLSNNIGLSDIVSSFLGSFGNAS